MSRINKKVVAEGYGLTVSDLTEVARNRALVSVPKKAFNNTQKGRDFIDRALKNGEVIYGTNTGFGSNVEFKISTDKLSEHQSRLVYSLSAGTPPFLNEEITRGFLLARINCLAKGYSGVRPEVISLLVDFLNNDILPLVSKYGSVGASGDLVPSAGLALALMGEGDVQFKGKKVSAKSALKKISRKPIIFQPKEALAIVNNTSVMTSVASLVTYDFEYLLDLMIRASAMYADVMSGTTDPFDDLLHELKNHEGSIAVASQLRSLLSGSKLALSIKKSKKVQDYYSIRCLPQVLGPHIELSELLKEWVSNELNSANDNPLIDWRNKKVLHGGNFSGFYIGIGMDIAKILLAHLANLEQTMIDRVLDHEKNHIFPPSLAQKDPGFNSGLKGVGISSGSYFAEIVQKSFSHSVLSRPFESGNQDMVSFGTLAAETAYDLMDMNHQVAARLIMVLCAAADIRGIKNLSDENQKLHKRVRAMIRNREEDQPGIGEDIMSIVSAIKYRKL